MDPSLNAIKNYTTTNQWRRDEFVPVPDGKKKVTAFEGSRNVAMALKGGGGGLPYIKEQYQQRSKEEVNQPKPNR